MRRIELATEVGRGFREVFAAFDRELFLRLRPPLLPFRLIRFDGCRPGDEVHIDLGPGGIWRSEIIEENLTESECSFVDVGRGLPFPLRDWRHVHRVIATGPGQARIVDDIEFSSGRAWLDALLAPLLRLLFGLRRPIYREVFGRASSVAADPR